MTGPIRTIVAGVAVVTLCLLLALLSWQFVLLTFGLAGLGFALWSLPRNAGQGRRPELSGSRFRANKERAPSKRRKALRRGNLYQFPVSNIARDAGAAD